MVTLKRGNFSAPPHPQPQSVSLITFQSEGDKVLSKNSLGTCLHCGAIHNVQALISSKALVLNLCEILLLGKEYNEKHWCMTQKTRIVKGTAIMTLLISSKQATFKSSWRIKMSQYVPYSFTDSRCKEFTCALIFSSYNG